MTFKYNLSQVLWFGIFAAFPLTPVTYTMKVLLDTKWNAYASLLLAVNYISKEQYHAGRHDSQTSYWSSN